MKSPSLPVPKPGSVRERLQRNDHSSTGRQIHEDAPVTQPRPCGVQTGDAHHISGFRRTLSQPPVTEPRPSGSPAWPYAPPKLMKSRVSGVCPIRVCPSHDREWRRVRVCLSHDREWRRVLNGAVARQRPSAISLQSPTPLPPPEITAIFARS